MHPANTRLSKLTVNTDIVTATRLDFIMHSFAFTEVSGGMLGGPRRGVKRTAARAGGATRKKDSRYLLLSFSGYPYGRAGKR
jgi:hypothetical protein